MVRMHRSTAALLLASLTALASAQNTVWGRAWYSQVSFTKVAIDNANYVTSFGRKPAAAPGLYDLFMIRYSPTGGMVWNVTSPASIYDRKEIGVELDAFGDPYFLWQSYSGSTISISVLTKLNRTTGGTVWEKVYDPRGTFNPNDRAIPAGVGFDAANRVYMVSTQIRQSGAPRANIQIYSPAGGLIAENNVIIPNGHTVIDTAVCPDGGVAFLTGTDPSLTTPSDSRIIHVRADATINFSSSAGYASQIAYQPGADRTFVTCGRTLNSQYKLSLFNSIGGEFRTIFDQTNATDNFVRIRDLTVNPQGMVCLVGGTSMNGGGTLYPWKGGYRLPLLDAHWSIDVNYTGEAMSVATDPYGTVYVSEINGPNAGALQFYNALDGASMGTNLFTASPTYPQQVRVNAGSKAAYVGRFMSAAYSQFAGFTRLVGTQGLAQLTLPQTTFLGGTSTTGTVRLYEAAASNTSVSLIQAGGGPWVTMQPSVIVPAGSATASFPVTVLPVAVDTNTWVAGLYNGIRRPFYFKVTAPVPTQVTLAPNPVHGGSPSAGRVRLNGIAPLLGIPVALSATSPAHVPATARVLSGDLTRDFTVRTDPVSVTAVRSITATYNGVTVTRTLTIIP